MLGSLWVPRGKKTPFNNRFIRMERTSWFERLLRDNPHHNLESSSGITNVVFEMLRNARAMPPQVTPDLVVCWGGHSITSHEYEYTKNCGYQLGLRRLNIITGCGPGAMKGPMKGAAIGHVKQHNRSETIHRHFRTRNNRR